IAAGATYVARGFTGQQKHLVELIKGGVQHRGFALIDTFSPCVTYNHDNTHEFFKQRTRKLDEMGHDPTDFHGAMENGRLWGDVIPIGLFWRREDLPALDQRSEEHTSELQSHLNLVCRLLLEKKKNIIYIIY